LDEAENRTWAHFLESTTLILDELNRQLMCAHGMSLADVQLLNLLAKSETGSARVGDVAAHLILSPSTLTGVISRLAKLGLVRRSVSAHDRRGVVVALTPAGRRCLQPVLTTYARFVRMHYLNPMTRRQMLGVGESGRRISAGLTGSQ
jgi:DNA-binding MarR family transcriptional regulator